MIIEVIGPAGSGKTTFVKNIYLANKSFDNGETAAFRGLLNCPEVNVRFVKLLQWIPVRLAFRLRLTKMTHFYRDQLLRSSYMTDFEPYVTHVFEAIQKITATNAEKLWLIDKCKDTITDYILIKQPINNDRVIFIDEFLVQKILSLYYLYDSSIKIDPDQEEYLRLVPKPKAIVFLDTDISTASARVLARGKGRPHVLKQLSEQDFIETNKRFKLIEKKVCDYLSNEYDVQTIVTDNNLGLQETFKEISDVLHRRSKPS